MSTYGRKFKLRRGGGTVIPPLPTTGLVARFKGTSGVTTSGGNVTAFVDSIGGVSLAPYGASNVPFNSSSINGVPGMTFNGTNGLFTTSTAILIGSVARYVFVICKTGASVAGANAALAFGGGPWFAATAGSGGNGLIYSDLGTRNQNTPFNAAIGTPYCLEYGWDGNTAHLLTFAHNGTSETVTATAGVGTTGGAANTFTIGNATNGTTGTGVGFVGDIVEVAIYSAIQSGAALTDERKYFQAQYRISLGV